LANIRSGFRNGVSDDTLPIVDTLNREFVTCGGDDGDNRDDDGDSDRNGGPEPMGHAVPSGEYRFSVVQCALWGGDDGDNGSRGAAKGDGYALRGE
jgi:hypothetical protein